LGGEGRQQSSKIRITKKGWQSSRRTTTRKGMSKGGGGGWQSSRRRITRKWTTKTKNKVAELKEEDHQEVDD